MAQRSRRWPGILFSLGVLALVLAEISGLIWISSEIGWWTIAVLSVSAALGIGLLAWQWGRARAALAEAMTTGKLPPGKLADASLILIGGIFLILPGLISDLVGLLLLVPFTRQFVRSGLSWVAARGMRRAGGGAGAVIPGEVVTEQPDETPSQAPQVIEGTIIDDEQRN